MGTRIEGLFNLVLVWLWVVCEGQHTCFLDLAADVEIVVVAFGIAHGSHRSVLKIY